MGKNRGEEIVVGITDFAQDALTEVVWVEWEKDEGEAVEVMESFASVESVKSNDIPPVSGEIVGLNHELMDNPVRPMRIRGRLDLQG